MSINFKFEYETPRAQVRGVFLCEDVAVPVSALIGNFSQEDWGTGEELVGDGTHLDGDVWVDL
jgi:hypothetical protein